jgi:hypothetical protein
LAQLRPSRAHVSSKTMKLHVAAVAWIASTLASSCNADEQIHIHGEEQPRRRELSQRWLNETQDFVDADMSDVSGTRLCVAPTIPPFERVQGTTPA